MRLDEAGLTVGAQRHPQPASGAELLSGLRTALRSAPKPEPDIAGVPLAGGLVGYAAYDVVRYFERLQGRSGLMHHGLGVPQVTAVIGGRLVTYVSYGHSWLLNGATNACMQKVVGDYFVSATLPARGTRCTA